MKTMDFISTDLTIFQAVGVISGKPFIDSELGWSIKLNEKNFRLFIPPAKYRGWLKEMQKGKYLHLTVYPRILLQPKRSHIVFFQVVGWSQTPLTLKHQEFVLKGIWQFIPQIKIPVLTIYRNKDAQDVFNRFKATHLPVFMRRSDCTPFRFVSNLKSAEHPNKYFIQGIFRFLPDKNAFGYQEDLTTPTTTIPGYKQPIRKKEKIKL